MKIAEESEENKKKNKFGMLNEKKLLGFIFACGDAVQLKGTSNS